MPLVYYVPEYERDASQTPLDAERLLRLLGVSGKLTGFRYAVYMVEQVRDQPENMILITKRLYAQTAAHFQTTPSCVERNLRTLIQSCWNYPDHSFLNLIAGAELRQPPTNSSLSTFWPLTCEIDRQGERRRCRLSLLPVTGNVAQFETDFDTTAIRHECIGNGASVRAGDSPRIE